MADIYRKSAPGQRGSDRTDQVMTVHTPAHWFLLAGLVLVFSGFMLWACFGTLSKTTTTTGLYHPGGSGYGEIIALMPLASGKTVDVGMDVTVSLSGYSMQEYGHMKGTISYVDPYTTSTNDMLALLEDELLVNGYVQNGACVKTPKTATTGAARAAAASRSMTAPGPSLPSWRSLPIPSSSVCRSSGSC